MPEILLLTQEAEDLKRDAGLRGDQFTTAVVFLCIVFAIGIGGVAWIAFRSRQRKPD